MNDSEPRQKRYYLASNFGNIAQVRRLDAYLTVAGYGCACRWWELEEPSQNAPWAERVQALEAAAVSDLAGIAAADIVIVLQMHGPTRARGSHMELGAALLGATYIGGVRVVLAGAAEMRVDPVAFYYHPKVVRVFDASEAILFQRLLQEVERS